VDQQFGYSPDIMTLDRQYLSRYTKENKARGDDGIPPGIFKALEYLLHLCHLSRWNEYP